MKREDETAQPAPVGQVERWVRPHRAEARKARTFVLNFKREFAGLVERGYKKQTIRGHRKDGKRPVQGDQVRLYTGLRTSATRWLRDGTVVRCRSVRLNLAGNGEIVVDGERLTLEQRFEFAKADGFLTWEDMRKWFCDQYGAESFPEWEGFCVEWA